MFFFPALSGDGFRNIERYCYMTEQERKKAFENQRKIARRKEKEADGTLEVERRIQYEKKRREKLRKERRMRALKQRIVTIVVLIVFVIVVLSVALRFCGKKNKEPQKGLPVQTSQEAVTNSIEADNEPMQTQLQEEVPQTILENASNETQQETAIQQTDAQPVESQAAESVAATVNAVDTSQVIDPSGIVIPSWITVDLIHINNVSRPAIALDAVHDIAIHYVANPGSSAKANRDYFDSLDNPAVEGAGRKASAHLIVGLEGEIIQCLPLNEMAYAVRSRNPDTISIEVCHPDETGKFSDVTYNALVKLTAWLLQQEGLTPDHVIRHFDCDGKACPLYYVENEDAWNKLKQDIADYYYANPNIQ